MNRFRRLAARAFGGACLALALTVSWVIFAGSLQPLELVVGAAAAGLAMVALRSSELRSLARIIFVGRLFAQARHLPLDALRGTRDVVHVLFRQLAGREAAPSLLAASAYVAVGDSDFDATRRALAITLTTITPNVIVIDIDRARGLLLFHQLRESESSAMTLALGAEA
jgi:multisubunit Na+/H+ antiporter MnhE subunit